MWGNWEDVKKSYEKRVSDPWDWVTHFENIMAKYAGSKYAIACDSNSNAIKLMLEYEFTRNDHIGNEISIPINTYCSVANAILLSQNTLLWDDRQWEHHYNLTNTPIYDGAVSLYEGMYSVVLDEYEPTNPQDAVEDFPYLILSFHHRKILNIGTGGMILTNDEIFAEWARPMIYDGRDKLTKYDDNILSHIGWHMYMSPEQAIEGLKIFHSDRIDRTNETKHGKWSDYKRLDTQPIYQNLQIGVNKKSQLRKNKNGDYDLNNIVIQSSTPNSNLYRIYDYLFNLEMVMTLKDEFDPLIWKKSFDRYSFHLDKTDRNFIIFDDIEDFSDWDSNPIIVWIKDYFKSIGLLDRLYFYGNSHKLPRNSEINYTPIPFFLGDTAWLSRIINPSKTTFGKRFISAQSAPRPHRIQLQNFLEKNDLLKQCHYSWNPNNKFIEQPILQKYPKLLKTKGLSDVNEGKLDVLTMHTLPDEWFDSFCALVTETNFYPWLYNNNSIFKEVNFFLTEKTEKCFTVGIPFIIFSTPNYLKRLRELGFKTFDKWWDESYDSIENPEDRFKAIEKIVEEIASWEEERVNRVYSEMESVLKYNQTLNIEINKVNKGIKRSPYAYNSSMNFEIPSYCEKIEVKSYLIPPKPFI